MSDFSNKEQILKFNNYLRKSALDWNFEFYHIISSNIMSVVIMNYFNKFDNYGLINKTIKYNFYHFMNNYYDSYKLIYCKNWNCVINDFIIDYVIGISHQIPSNEIAELIIFLLNKEAKLSELAISVRSEYGF